ncbi:hypothetical protein DYB28_004785 [Aphanomyces astaci]|uniref:Uncharacterized protein n=1 Tax=Aphanomyces astaci TaxID=112090 RepID=A0A9X8DMR9_APHAT|nr:hypothetical protein DYB28_004785 [Aphanomyces astaci]
MEFPGTGNEYALDMDYLLATWGLCPSSIPVGSLDESYDPCTVDRFEDRGRPRSSATARRLFRSPQGMRQPVAVVEAWSYGRPATFAAPGFGIISGTVPGPTLEKEDVNMGQNDVHLHNAPTLPKNPTFKGSTKEERRVFTAA